MFLAEVGASFQQEKLISHPPLLTIVATAGSCLPTMLTSKLGMNIKMLARLFDQDKEFMSAVSNKQGQRM